MWTDAGVRDPMSVGVITHVPGCIRCVAADDGMTRRPAPRSLRIVDTYSMNALLQTTDKDHQRAHV